MLKPYSELVKIDVLPYCDKREAKDDKGRKVQVPYLNWATCKNLLHENGAEVTVITGFRNKDLVILEEEFDAVSEHRYLVSDDGSTGVKGLVTNVLEELIEKGEQFDEVIAIGPLPMMKFVCLLTKKYGIKTIVSMNPIMIDGTGMCGCCRLSVGGEMKFACVDGPDFDGHLVDFDEAMARNSAYRDAENRAREATCNLFQKEVA